MRLFFLSLLLTLSVGCTKLSVSELSSDISREDKLTNEVINYIKLFHDNGYNTKSEEIAVCSIDTLHQTVKSNNSKPFYLYNFKDDMGFALVSSDSRDNNQIYIAATNGHLNPEQLIDRESPYYLLYDISCKFQEKIINY